LHLQPQVVGAVLLAVRQALVKYLQALPAMERLLLLWMTRLLMLLRSRAVSASSLDSQELLLDRELLMLRRNVRGYIMRFSKRTWIAKFTTTIRAGAIDCDCFEQMLFPCDRIRHARTCKNAQLFLKPSKRPLRLYVPRALTGIMHFYKAYTTHSTVGRDDMTVVAFDGRSL